MQESSGKTYAGLDEMMAEVVTERGRRARRPCDDRGCGKVTTGALSP